jgi:hypothetical protein
MTEISNAEFEEYLWDWIEYLAKKRDGHFTLMKFTTHWKAMFFTPDLDGGKGRSQVTEISAGKTRKETLIIAIAEMLIKEA